MLVVNVKSLWTFVIVALFLSCQSDNKESYSIFKYNESAGVNSLDPAFAKDQASIWVANQMFNGLVQLDSNLNIQASIAHSWDLSKDGKEYTFYLRSDVYFHHHKLFNSFDERRVTANDFIYSFSRLTDPKIASPGAWVMTNIDTVFAKNDSTLCLVLKRSFPPFLGLLSIRFR